MRTVSTHSRNDRHAVRFKDFTDDTVATGKREGKFVVRGRGVSRSDGVHIKGEPQDRNDVLVLCGDFDPEREFVMRAAHQLQVARVERGVNRSLAIKRRNVTGGFFVISVIARNDLANVFTPTVYHNVGGLRYDTNFSTPARFNMGK